MATSKRTKAAKKTAESTSETVDAYIASFPSDVQAALKKVRAVIKKSLPKASETIKYHMPTYTLDGNVIFFAGYKQHIAVYPHARSDAKLTKALASYERAKGTYRFPLGEPIPFDLIGKLAKARAKEHLAEKQKK